MNKVSIAILSLFLVSGCENTMSHFSAPKQEKVIVKEQSEIAKQIASTLTDVDLYECKLCFVVTKGMVSYLKHDATGVKYTKDLFVTYNKVLESYSLEDPDKDVDAGKLEDFENKVVQILSDAGYMEPSLTVDKKRDDLIKIFNEIADGCQLAAKNKAE